ncbi:FkbM family methyltransferase [Bordetella muralis]|jgi:FkbM family methyltransferase|uniref:FkbM family methyltransferase n=1 Tax=Bordetella muralis TaxID=1649130 RepID=UPI0039EEE3F8
MSFISYAQNYEDVMLRRVLKSVSRGFYVDIGAAWPDEHSVTKAFYDQGWSGINVEPNPKFHAALVSARPRDINLRVAIGEHSGEAVMNIIDGTGLSSVDDGIVQGHIEAGWNPDRQTVKMERLVDILETHVPAGQDIHFLKVDVEGLEEQALRGNDWRKFRPWVVLVEATLPMSQTPSYEQWEPILLDAGYLFSYADGLNRFYVAEEQAALRGAFAYPPNVFDDFKGADLMALEMRLELLEHEKQRLEHLVQQAEQRVQRAEQQVQQAAQLAQETERRVQDLERQKDHADHQLRLIQASTSWRLTAPFRGVSNRLFKHGLKAQVWSTVRSGVRYVNGHAKLRRTALRVLNHMPGLKDKLRRVMGLVQTAPVSMADNYDSYNSSDLTAHANRIYEELQAAYKHVGQEKH